MSRGAISISRGRIRLSSLSNRTVGLFRAIYEKLGRSLEESVSGRDDDLGEDEKSRRLRAEVKASSLRASRLEAELTRVRAGVTEAMKAL
ncbi:hypothetical protein N7536_005842 [Penicillium majusculum]|nr:hypothetical protein N7536_005842 [Penicillium majusculum]